MAAVCRFVLASLSLAFALPLAAQQYSAEMLSGLFASGRHHTDVLLKLFSASESISLA
jgi:hypothetical protein